MVHAEETSLRVLLEGAKQFQVPLYQRTFSWTNAELGRLWHDLVNLVEDRRTGRPDTSHFLGSMVLATTTLSGPVGVQTYLVVDGQQRLTALTLLLAAIRDHRAETEDPRHCDRINEMYLLNKWNHDHHLKLLPTQVDRAPYLACIDRTPLAGDSSPVGAAYRFFRSRLVDFDDPDDELDVEQLEEAVMAGLSLVSVTAQPGDNVHRIFESLNNTGLSLTQGDLIRNYLFMRLPTMGERVYESSWLPLEKSLSSRELELLFWLDLVQRDDTAKQSDTYTLQQKRLDRLGSEAEVASEVARFGGLGMLLKIILDPTAEDDARVRRGLQRLDEWGTTTTYPLLLKWLEQRSRGEVTSDDVADAMGVLESYLVRRLVVGRATNNLNRILARAVIDTGEAQNPAEALRRHLSGQRKYFPTDTEIREAVRSVAFYWSGRASQRKLVLLWLEESYGSKEPVAPDLLTVEHVLPQTLTEEWRQALEVDLEPGEEIEEVHQELVHTIGNLTLTGYNSELSNDPFEVKRREFGHSGLKMNQEIAARERWGRNEIQARAESLAERIIEAWPGPDPVAVVESVRPVWGRLARLMALIPAGRWTTYGDVATVIGTHPVPLGQRLANHPVLNAQRVLSSSGQASEGFRWLEAGRVETQREALEAEGVRFDAEGRADPSQRLTAEDLASLWGEDNDPDSTGFIVPGREKRSQMFLDQLARLQDRGVVEGVEDLVRAWVDMGGDLDFGNARETSCFLLTSLWEKSPWPLVLYPSGAVEVVFQHLARRPPFDDVELRHEFRRRLNTVPGIEIGRDRISLRPSFPISILARREVRDSLLTQLSWFMERHRDHLARIAAE